MKRWLVPGAVAAALAVAGCAGGGGSELEGAVFASTVPVVKNATFDGQMGGSTYGGDMGEESKSMSWFFVTEEPMDQVVAFYREELVGWTEEEDSDGGEKNVTFTGKPEGANEGEYVQVILSPGKVQIHESYAASRAKS